jgi:hypothetical protein
MPRKKDMPVVQFGEKADFSNSQFTKLKGKGDKIRFRLLGAPFIQGKHFFEIGPKEFDVQDCPRVNEKSECQHCTTYFKIMARGKKTGDKTVMEQAKKEAEPFKATISAYFPILNRQTETFQIFQNKLGLKGKVEAEKDLGVKVLNVDWIVSRTEEPGANYYSLSRVDSAETPELSEKEKVEIQKIDTLNWDEIMGNGSVDEESALAQEANSEVRAEDDINF